MLILDNKLNDLAVLSVQAARPIGRVVGYIIDPRKLYIVALYVDNRLADEPLILHTADIREFNNRGALIDHDEQLMDTDGLVRLQEIIDYKFGLVGKLVETDGGRKLGKVSSFAFDALSWMVIRLNVTQSLVKNMSESELIVHRKQVVKVTNDKIIVDSNTVKLKEKFSLKKLFLGSKPAMSVDSIDLKY